MASLVRWTPWNELASVHNEMSRLMNGILEGNGRTTQAWVPALDVWEREDEIVYAFDLPGIPEESIEVEFEDGSLTVSAERERKHEVSDERFYRFERRYGTFSRTIGLPQGVDESAIRADYADGVLEVHVGERRLAELLQAVGDTQRGLLEIEQPTQVDRRADEHELSAGAGDRLAELVDLAPAVSHRRQQRPDVRVPSEGLGDRADGEGAGIHELGRTVLLRREHRRAVGHLPVRQRRAVLDRENALAADAAGVALDIDRRRGQHDARIGVSVDRVQHAVDAVLLRAVDLVHDADVRHAQVRLTGVIAQLVSRPVRVDDDDVQIGTDERRVVVAAVPDDHFGVALREVEDRRVVDAGEDEVSLRQVRLVLLALLDRRIRCVEIVVPLEALHRLSREVAVRHRVPDDRDALAGAAQQRRHSSRGLALTGARAYGADGDARLRRREHRLARREQLEGRSCGERSRSDVHHVLVRDVRVGEDDDLHLVLAHERVELVLCCDGDPGGIEGPGELRRVEASFDVRDLGRREGDDLDVLATSVGDVEVVKVAPRSTGDQHPRPGHG